MSTRIYRCLNCRLGYFCRPLLQTFFQICFLEWQPQTPDLSVSLFCLHLRLWRFYFGLPLSPTCHSAQEGAGKSSLSPQGGKRRAGSSSQNPTETLAPQVHANEGRGINILDISSSGTHTSASVSCQNHLFAFFTLEMQLQLRC